MSTIEISQTGATAAPETWEALGTSVVLRLDTWDGPAGPRAGTRWSASSTPSTPRPAGSAPTPSCRASTGPVAAGCGSDRCCDAIALAIRAAQVSDGAVDPTLGRDLIELGYYRDWRELNAAAGELDDRARAPMGTRTPRGLAAAGARRCPSQRPLPARRELDLGATAKAWRPTARSGGRGRRRGRAGGLGGDIAVRGARPARTAGGFTSPTITAPCRRPRQTVLDRLGRPGDLEHQRAQLVAGQQRHASHPRSPRRAPGRRALAHGQRRRGQLRGGEHRLSTAAIVLGDDATAGSTSTNCPRAWLTRHGAAQLVGGWPGDRGTERLLVSHARDRRGRPVLLTLSVVVGVAAFGRVKPIAGRGLRSTASTAPDRCSRSRS